MKLPIPAFSGFLLVLLALGAPPTWGQVYPDRPIRMVTAEIGGGADITARLIAAGLSSGLGQQVVVDNRGGASGAIATQAVAKAPPDGYTLLLYSSVLWIVPLLQDVAWDPVRDFAPVSLAAASPNILVVHPSVPVRNVKELIALAKTRPGRLNYASGGTGSSPHLAAEMFKSMAGVNIVRIVYKGIGAATTDLIAGEVDLSFGSAGSVAAHVRSGRLKPLAVTGVNPSLGFPGLPTIANSGLPGYEMETIYGVWGPAKTAGAIVSRLQSEIARVLSHQDVKAKLLAIGIESVGSSPERLAAQIKSDTVRMGKLIRDANIRSD